jgi:hypothetical protein
MTPAHNDKHLWCPLHRVLISSGEPYVHPSKGT